MEHLILCGGRALQTLFTPHSHGGGGALFLPPFTHDKTEAQRGKVICAVLHDYKWQNTNSGLTHFKAESCV